jgi:NADPH-dependent 7-cyano-7-deazaguanine reductase QueF-like protein
MPFELKAFLDSYNQEQIDAIKVVLGFLDTDFRTCLSNNLPSWLSILENQPCSKDRGSVYLIDGKQ